MGLSAKQDSLRWVHAATTPAALRICAALTLAAGLLSTPAAAHAAPNPPTRLAPSSACGSEVTPADRAVAARLRPSMNGPRLGRAVNGASIACARIIVDTVRSRGLPERAAVIAMATAIAESTLHNHTVARDHDSLGLFQQRPSMGWGRPDQVTDPAYATNKFLDAMIRKHPGDGWLGGDIGRICQKVQQSAFPDAYAPEVFDAQLIVGQLWTGTAGPRTASGSASPGSASSGSATPSTPAPAQPAGPFQRVLSAAQTGLGPTDERHHLSTADWNGDRHADLVVVQGAGTTSGKTEVRIMSGVTAFQAVLLHTATALGPTDQHHQFSMADWNTDGRLDLLAVQTSGTASGRTELRIVDGASGFQRLLLDVATTLPPGDDQEISLADWNADGRPDLVTLRKPDKVGDRAQVRVVDGTTDFQKEFPKLAVAPDAANERDEMLLADWNGDRRPDLVTVRRAATAGEPAEVRILDGASGLRRPLLRTSTALGTTDQRHDLSVADWNGDGKLDLVVTQKPGTPTGPTEALVLDGSAQQAP